MTKRKVAANNKEVQTIPVSVKLDGMGSLRLSPAFIGMVICVMASHDEHDYYTANDWIRLMRSVSEPAVIPPSNSSLTSVFLPIRLALDSDI